MPSNVEEYTNKVAQEGLAGKSIIETCGHKVEIDQMIDDNRSLAYIQSWMQDELEINISKQSIMKYKKKREIQLKNQLEKMPEYQTKMQYLSQDLVDGIGKIKQVDIIGSLSDIITQSSELLRRADDDDIKITSVQDMRFVTQNMMDAIKLYGDTVLKAQKFNEINKNPELLKPNNTNITIQIQDMLASVLKESITSGQGFDLVDKLRSGMHGTHHETSPVIDVESKEV